jgi:hypothetical protein
MKKTLQQRRAEALERLRASTFDNSRAKRTGSQSREEWQASKDATISRLEELNGFTTSQQLRSA